MHIEQLDKHFQSQFLVSEQVWVMIEESGLPADDLGLVEIRGYRQPVRLYRLI